VLTGGRLISEDLGIKLENIKIEELGRAKRVTIDKENTTIVEGEGKKADIQGRVAQIRRQIERDDQRLRSRENCRSAWRNSPVALRSSTSALRPRPR